MLFMFILRFLSLFKHTEPRKPVVPAVPAVPVGTVVPVVARSRHLVQLMGGKPSTIKHFPYHVALEEDGEYHCGGVIVSSRNVLTAAHCFDHVDATKLTVRSGTPFRERGGTVHKVLNFTRHPKFRMTLFDNAHYDIAVIRVAEPFKYEETRSKADLFNFGELVKPGDIASITGWGLDESCELSKEIKYVQVPIVNQTECNRLYGKFGGLDEGEICAGNQGTGSWHGDSGGPLTIGNTSRVAGIVSYGEGCKRPEYPGVFSDVGFFRTWIDRYVEYDTPPKH